MTQPKSLSPLEYYVFEAGFIPLDAYMGLALQHPDFGYYRCGIPLGPKGDFITSPEISPLFGHCLATWVTKIWHESTNQAPFTLIEWGPGRGMLLMSLLLALPKEVRKSMSVLLIESNPDLRKLQEKALADDMDKGLAVTWSDNIDVHFPETAIISLANEFWDALPIKQFIKNEKNWFERGVVWDYEKKALAFARIPCTAPPDHLTTTTFCEYSPAGLETLERIAKHISTRGGGHLIIDYGADSLACTDTFQAMAQHASVDPLAQAGQCDLTAHVNFAHLMSALGPFSSSISTDLTTQSDFLKRMDIMKKAEILLMSTPPGKARHHLTNALNRLLSPRHMGELFKVLSMQFQPS